MGTSKKHVHKYMHVQLKFAKVWRCSLPDCFHYMPPHMEEMLLGRRSICWGCSNTFVLDEINMQDEQPLCFNCRMPNAVVETPLGDISAIEQFLREKEKEKVTK